MPASANQTQSFDQTGLPANIATWYELRYEYSTRGDAYVGYFPTSTEAKNFAKRSDFWHEVIGAEDGEINYLRPVEVIVISFGGAHLLSSERYFVDEHDGVVRSGKSFDPNNRIYLENRSHLRES